MADLFPRLPLYETGINGQVVHGVIVCDLGSGMCGHDIKSDIISGSGGWYSDGQKLGLSYVGRPGTWFTIITASPTHMELTDAKDDISWKKCPN